MNKITAIKRPCICHPPPLVDVTESFGGTDDESAESEALRKNLAHYGWSHVRVRATAGAPDDSVGKLLQSHDTWRTRLTALFDAGSRVRETPGITCRTAESGAPGTVEPKESLEVMRRRGGAGVSTLEPLKELMLFTDLLHRVACTVRKCLGLPANVLLEDDSSADPDTEYALDLLRVFYYDKGEATSLAMGSNEHTDWGSFTVVWQDLVGGLQTFCHACQTWVNVTPLPNKSNHAVFVVHVGDMTSLCLGLALEEECPQAKEGEQLTVTWPSPKHRVVSPTQSQRLSLVYFAYPPPTATMASMKEGLKEWSRAHAPSCCVTTAFDDYYLLLNQSNEGKALDPTETYTKIKSRPVGDVLREKWDQVQR
jgi:hypothetical protein